MEDNTKNPEDVLEELGFSDMDDDLWTTYAVGTDKRACICAKADSNALQMYAYRIAGSESAPLRICTPRFMELLYNKDRCVQRMLGELKTYAHEMDVLAGKQDTPMETAVAQLYEKAADIYAR